MPATRLSRAGSRRQSAPPPRRPRRQPRYSPAASPRPCRSRPHAGAPPLPLRMSASGGQARGTSRVDRHAAKTGPLGAPLLFVWCVAFSRFCVSRCPSGRSESSLHPSAEACNRVGDGRHRAHRRRGGAVVAVGARAQRTAAGYTSIQIFINRTGRHNTAGHPIRSETLGLVVLSNKLASSHAVRTECSALRRGQRHAMAQRSVALRAHQRKLVQSFRAVVGTPVRVSGAQRQQGSQRTRTASCDL